MDEVDPTIYVWLVALYSLPGEITENDQKNRE